jgi:hypothetical protein
MLIIDQIRNNQFLPASQGIDTEFARTDNKKLFEKHLKSMPATWYYRLNQVNYTVNSENYRTDEFDTIDWSQSIVIFGCSNVFGTGITDEDTISANLSKITNRPVINMGMGGTSMHFAMHNSTILRNRYTIPYAVVHIWSSIERCMLYEEDCITSLTPADRNNNFLTDHWCMDIVNPHVHGLFIQAAERLKWQNLCRFYEATFFEHTASTLGCDLLQCIDKARDNMHPGRETAAITALSIARNIK